MALTYKEQGRWDEAEELMLEALEASRTMLGDERPDTWSIKGNLAIIYRNQMRLADAENLEVQLLEARKQILGDEHPDTLQGK
jgi:hypothetical protein